MKITFLGHQSWLISSHASHVLVDPVLTSSFGTSTALRFRINPQREIDTKALPALAAVAITNEHLDHFHIPSLMLLDRNVPIYVGQMMPSNAKASIRSLGFTVHECAQGKLYNLEGFALRFFIGRAEVPFWEKRVYSLYLSDRQSNDLIIQSDTLISDTMIAFINEQVTCNRAFITTNNSQLKEDGRLGAFGNLLPLDDDTNFINLNIINELLIDYPAQIAGINHIFLSGSGYVLSRGDVISQAHLLTGGLELSATLNWLSEGVSVHALPPGEVVDIVEVNPSALNVGYVTLNTPPADRDAQPVLSEQNDSFWDQGPIVKQTMAASVIKQIIEQELNWLAQLILLTDFGKLLLSTNEYLDGPLGSIRFLIIFKTEPNVSYCYGFDINSAAFLSVDSDEASALNHYPFGLILYAEDYVALHQGQLQIWEIAAANLQQWYLGDKLQSPVALFYAAYCEQMRPDLSTKVYEKLRSG